MSFELTIKGMDNLIANLNALAANMPGEVGNALRAEAEIEMTEAKKRTPLKTGALRASGHVTGPTQVMSGLSGTVTEVKMGFGGPAGSGNVGGQTNSTDVGYAVPVHENYDAFHPLGQAGYLSSVLLESVPHLAARVAARIDLTLAMKK